MTTSTDRPTTASSFDDDYPARTMGRAAEMTATTAGFLRALGEHRLITPLRSEGGHRRSPFLPTGSPGCACGAGRGVRAHRSPGCFERGSGAADGARERDPVPGGPSGTVDDGVRRR
ncbi:hypothetical protein Kpho01_31030 [Kitasatospora phosalacinea]|uniref:HTH merR-type domain-containing protein n=1 Tax=Kitasatospora phosalacinea TaxID=2065 RepID=A0A9W6UPF2_9ACTN|nr:hypothetical protein Kpho01_31030 [Kitasatospora phosalacinea]